MSFKDDLKDLYDKTLGKLNTLLKRPDINSNESASVQEVESQNESIENPTQSAEMFEQSTQAPTPKSGIEAEFERLLAKAKTAYKANPKSFMIRTLVVVFIVYFVIDEAFIAFKEPPPEVALVNTTSSQNQAASLVTDVAPPQDPNLDLNENYGIVETPTPTLAAQQEPLQDQASLSPTGEEQEGQVVYDPAPLEPIQELQENPSELPLEDPLTQVQATPTATPEVLSTPAPLETSALSANQASSPVEVLPQESTQSLPSEGGIVVDESEVQVLEEVAKEIDEEILTATPALSATPELALSPTPTPEKKVIKLEIKDYVAPPAYNVLGRGLVYNCKQGHWACVDQDSYVQCKSNEVWQRLKKKDIECVPIAVYANEKDCARVQTYKINTSASKDFCRIDAVGPF